jgi:hypothetical protein
VTIFGTAAPKIAKNLKDKGGAQVGKAIGFYVTGGEGPLANGGIERAVVWAKGVAKNAI